MSDEKTYYQERLPDLIDALKSQVKKNMDVINREVERDLSSDRYFNVLKGRRMGAEYAISGMREIDKLEKDVEGKQESYYKSNLPLLIERLKEMYDINLKVVDLDIDDEDFGDDLKGLIEDDINEIFGKDIAKRLFKKIGNDKLSEDKFHNVLKARDAARIDCQWVLGKIDELENELKGKDFKKDNTIKSWELVGAQD